MNKEIDERVSEASEEWRSEVEAMREQVDKLTEVRFFLIPSAAPLLPPLGFLFPFPRFVLGSHHTADGSTQQQTLAVRDGEINELIAQLDESEAGLKRDEADLEELNLGIEGRDAEIDELREEVGALEGDLKKVSRVFHRDPYLCRIV